MLTVFIDRKYNICYPKETMVLGGTASCGSRSCTYTCHLNIVKQRTDQGALMTEAPCNGRDHRRSGGTQAYVYLIYSKLFNVIRLT